VKHKLKTLPNLAEKLEVFEAMKTCQKKKDVAEQLGLPMSTLLTIIKNESDIVKKFKTVKICPVKDNKLQNFSAWNVYRNGLTNLGTKITVLVDRCYKKKP